jgi:hypothetical protein
VGDSALVNDDIFAILTLTHAGYTQSDDIIKKIAAFVLSKQRPNGSWENSPDVTAAAMQALGSLFAVPGVNQGLGRAIGYVVSTQQANGGWGNPDSTAWVMTAINSANEAHPTPESAWTSSAGFFPRDALANDQAPDGGMRSSNDPVDTRVWTTSYALAAASGKSWVTILQSFPILSQTGGGGTPAESLIVATSSSATSTSATSTPEVQPQVLGASTSTLEISTNSSAVTTAMGTTTKKKISKDTVKKVTQTKPMTQPTVPAETKALVPRPQDPLVVRIKNWIWRFLGLQQVTPSFSL